MSSLRFDGVLFSAYPNDHLPRHVHAYLGSISAIVEIRPDRTVVLADRKDATSPRNAKRSSVKMLNVAAENFDELWALWEEMHEHSQSSNDRR
jgi:restriction endonuclease